MRRRTTHTCLTAAVAATLLLDVGCNHHRRYERAGGGPVDGPPPTVVDGPIQPIQPKPMASGTFGSPPLSDLLPVAPQLAEEPRYVAAYAAVHSPRVLVFVNRTVTGELVPATGGVPPASTVRVGLAMAPVADSTVTYLQPGHYDEAQARAIDYELIENRLSEELSARGKVTMIAPAAGRQRLTESEVRDLQAGRPQVLGQLLAKLQCDVLVQVAAHPSQQTADGLGIRLVAEALNTADGQSLAFAAVDVPPPLTKPTVNDYTRFTARKLMAGLSQTWEHLPGGTGVAAAPPPPAPIVTAPITPPPAPAPPSTAVPPPVVVTPAVPMAPATPSPRPPVPLPPATRPATTGPGDLLPPP